MGGNQFLKDLEDLLNSPIRDQQARIEQVILKKQKAENVYIEDNGKNVFHIIAKDPNRDVMIMKSFLGESTGGKSDPNIKQLFRMKHGSLQRTPLHWAVERGFLEFVEELLNADSELVCIQDSVGDTPLHIAARSNQFSSTDCISLCLCAAEKCDRLQLVLISLRNLKGNTPIHELCEHVPNKLEYNVEKSMILLLNNDCTNSILTVMNNSRRSPLHILCSNCGPEGTSDNRNRYLLGALVKTLIAKNENHVDYPTQDGTLKTALHLSCIHGLHSLTEILARCSETDVTQKDASGRMAIHYAAEISSKPGGYKCVKALVDWSALKAKMGSDDRKRSTNFINYLLWERDRIDQFQEVPANGTATSIVPQNFIKETDTALTLACKAKSAKSAECILRNLVAANEKFYLWFIGKDHIEADAATYSLHEVFKHTPEALLFLFDKSITIEAENSNERRVAFTTNIRLPTLTGLTRPIAGFRTESEMKYLGHSKNWPEEIRGKLLLHPLTRCALHTAWEKMCIYKIVWLIVNITWLAAFACLIPYDYSQSENGDAPIEQKGAAWILLLLTVMFTVNEILEMMVCGWVPYLTDLLRVNVWHWVQIALTFFAVFNTCFNVGHPSPGQIYCGTAGAILSYILFSLNLGIIYLPLGILVEYFQETLKQILAAFLASAPILIGFVIAFRQTLSEHFPGSIVWSFTRTMVMMTGEFEYKDTFGNDKNDSESANSTSPAVLFAESPTLNLLLFITFLIVVPVAFYNLVTGLVVDKVKNMASMIETHQIYNYIRLVNYVQRMIFKLNMIFCCAYFRCMITVESTSDGENIDTPTLSWYIDKDVQDPSFWSQLICTVKNTVCGCQHVSESRSAHFLPETVKKKLFDDYEKLAYGEEGSDRIFMSK